MHVLCWIKYCCMLFMASMARGLGVASFSLGLAQCVGARGSALGRLRLIELEVYDDDQHHPHHRRFRDRGTTLAAASQHPKQRLNRTVADLWEFPKIGVPSFGVLIIRILLFRVLH